MPDKQEKKTKITSGAPASQTDDGSKTKHQREANSMDQNNGGDAAPAPQKKEKTDEKRKAGGIQGALKFLNDVKIEAKKITWPPRSQVINETWSVIVMVAFITFMVLGFDYALGNWIFGPIEHAAKMMAPSTPDPLFQEVPSSPDGKTPEGATKPAPGTNIPVPAGAVPGTPEPTDPGSAPVTPAPTSTTEPGSTLPPAGTMPGLPAPTSPSAPQTTPGATTPPATTPPAATAPVAPQTAVPAATPASTTAPQSPATPTTPHP